METFQTAVSRDIALDVTTIEARGKLASPQASKVQTVLTNCLNECPASVIVDLTACPDVSPEAMAMIADTATQAHEEFPPVTVMLCGPSSPATSTLPRFESRSEAMRAAADSRARQPIESLTFERSPSAPGRIRNWLAAICRRWLVPNVCSDAELVVSELVTNAVTHGGTGGTVEVALRDGFLHIRVRDDGASLPETTPAMPTGAPGDALPSGRGLALVRLLSSAWGFLVDSRGSTKVVWAALRWQPAAA